MVPHAAIVVSAPQGNSAIVQGPGSGGVRNLPSLHNAQSQYSTGAFKNNLSDLQDTSVLILFLSFYIRYVLIVYTQYGL